MNGKTNAIGEEGIRGRRENKSILTYNTDVTLRTNIWLTPLLCIKNNYHNRGTIIAPSTGLRHKRFRIEQKRLK